MSEFHCTCIDVNWTKRRFEENLIIETVCLTMLYEIN